MKLCRKIESCAVDPCDALAEIGHLLPRGRLWALNDRTYTGFWSAIAQLKSDTVAAICQEWNEADPCLAVRTLDRWAVFYQFPLDCVDLTNDKLCEWIDLVASCPPLSEGFLPRLLDFVGIQGVVLEHKKPWASFAEFCECKQDLTCQSNCSLTRIVISAPRETFTFEEICWDGCFGSLEETMNLMWDCERFFIPEIECLRRCYFPAGLPVVYRISGECLEENNVFHSESWTTLN